MMTVAQRQQFYIPRWLAAAGAMGWTMRQGRLTADLARCRAAAEDYPAGHPLRELLPRLIDHAVAAAVADHRAVNADDLRHACNAAASDWRRTSARELSNPELTRVCALFALLVDAEDLDALIHWADPGMDARAGMLRALRRMNSAAASAIAQNAFHCALDDCTESQLRWLFGKLRKPLGPRSSPLAPQP